MSTINRTKLTYFTLAGLFLATILIWQAIFAIAPDNILEIAFFDVGQGDSIFIECPNGRQVLIDGGPDNTVLERLGEAMPVYDRDIDLVILTHPDNDHVTGLVDVLEHYDVGCVMTSGFEATSAAYRAWKEVLGSREVPEIIIHAGQKIVLQSRGGEEEVVLEIFWPREGHVTNSANNASIVGRLRYGESEFLLTGDIEKAVEKEIISDGWNIRADVLKVAHHGSKSSTDRDFLELVAPDIAVISIGENNRYGHPHASILERLQDVDLYRTDVDGNVQILTDGEFFNIKTEK